MAIWVRSPFCRPPSAEEFECCEWNFDVTSALKFHQCDCEVMSGETSISWQRPQFRPASSKRPVSYKSTVISGLQTLTFARTAPLRSAGVLWANLCVQRHCDITGRRDRCPALHAGADLADHYDEPLCMWERRSFSIAATSGRRGDCGFRIRFRDSDSDAQFPTVTGGVRRGPGGRPDQSKNPSMQYTKKRE